jgi:hypothetical protein
MILTCALVLVSFLVGMIVGASLLCRMCACNPCNPNVEMQKCWDEDEYARAQALLPPEGDADGHAEESTPS